MPNDFWGLSDGSTATDTGTSYETPTGGDLIPNDSSVLASIDEIKWTTDQNSNEYINARWVVTLPDELANRKIFQKLWVTDDEPRAKDPQKKRDKARKMLAAMDANAGGKLARKNGKPTDDDLAFCLIGKPMVLKVMTYDMQNSDGSRNVGNWIAAVNPKTHPTKLGAEPAPKRPAQAAPQNQQTPAGGRRTDFDDEIPF